MEFQSGILIITDSISVNATVVEWTLQHFSVGLKDLRIITQASLLEGNLYFKSSSLSAVVSISEKPGFHTQLWLLELAKVLKSGGSVVLQEPTFFDGDEETELEESRLSLERNLLFAGFTSLEYSECLDHSAEISSASCPRNFELIAIQATKPWDTDISCDIQRKQTQKANTSINFATVSSTKLQFEDMDDFSDEYTLSPLDDSKEPDLPLDSSTLLRERIRERNRLYQRRRRARMTEEQREREKERRRQYMQSRRVHPNCYEMQLPLPVSYEKSKDCEQGALCGQQLRESQGIEMEENQIMGEAGEAL